MKVRRYDRVAPFETHNGIWVLYRDISEILEGMPNKDDILYVARVLGAFDEWQTADINPDRDKKISIGWWLRRVADWRAKQEGK